MVEEPSALKSSGTRSCSEKPRSANERDVKLCQAYACLARRDAKDGFQSFFLRGGFSGTCRLFWCIIDFWEAGTIGEGKVQMTSSFVLSSLWKRIHSRFAVWGLQNFLRCMVALNIYGLTLIN